MTEKHDAFSIRVSLDIKDPELLDETLSEADYNVTLTDNPSLIDDTELFGVQDENFVIAINIELSTGLTEDEIGEMVSELDYHITHENILGTEIVEYSLELGN